MGHAETIEPLGYAGVMVSSSFTDLKDHRTALIKAIDGQALKPVAMENDSARPAVDVLDASLQMVSDAAAYVGVIGRRYGQVPSCPSRNPNGFSLTELELNHARSLGRPVLLFIMGPDHYVREADVEIDPQKRIKLAAFRENAKVLTTESSVHRVYKVFNDLEEFRVAVTQSVAELRRYLEKDSQRDRDVLREGFVGSSRSFLAEPPYIGSHQFTGRKAQLDALSDWSKPADTRPILLFDAIGGTGKSMLTWEWTTKFATSARNDWAGRFWYSFYEKGSVMADFCRRSLVYMTGCPYEELRTRKMYDLAEELVDQLQRRPWLLVLDGLERVLVAYHRLDAAQITDEQAGAGLDQIANRDPCSSIRPEDDDLLRVLAGVTVSKLLLTSRLVPRVLLNRSGQPIAGVRRVSLPGLDPLDAELLIRSCDVSGTSARIQSYLDTHCDCHPLVIGIVAGLVHDYMPNRGNFDAWAEDAHAGGHLDLANLDLVQKRNHILHAAIAALTIKSRDLLSTLALLSEAVDYDTLIELNPYMPPKPVAVAKPDNPEEHWRWAEVSKENRSEALEAYRIELNVHAAYEQELATWSDSKEVREAPQELAATVRDLERRGLLQYDSETKRYDLHPVVRGVAAGGLLQSEKARHGQRVIDLFSQKVHDPYKDSKTLDDVRIGIRLVRTMLQVGRYADAFSAYDGALSSALFFNLEAYAEVLSILRPFFADDWAQCSAALSEDDRELLANDVAFALRAVGERKESITAYGGLLRSASRRSTWRSAWIYLVGISAALEHDNRLEKEELCLVSAMHLAERASALDAVFATRVSYFHYVSLLGQWSKADAIWGILNPMGRRWARTFYRAGTAEHRYARYRFWRGDLTEKHLSLAEQLAGAENNREITRELCGLRGEWHLVMGRSAMAVESLSRAVRMANETARRDVRAEAQLALAKFRLKQLPSPEAHAEQLSDNAQCAAEVAIARLWQAIGDADRARRHAAAGYKWAWSDGDSYVRYHDLVEARNTILELGAEIPTLRSRDAVRDIALGWEDEVAAAIRALPLRKDRPSAFAAE